MDRDLSDPNRRMLADVLIYSPTITAGVSIEVEHYDVLFGIFTDKSCNAYNAAQMLGRVRNISTNSVHLHVQYSVKQRQRRETLLGLESQSAMSITGCHISPHALYTTIWFENRYVNHLSECDYLGELL